MIIYDNRPQFVSQSFYKLCDKLRNKSIISTTYNPVTNGQAKAFNETMIKLLRKLVKKNKGDGIRKLTNAYGPIALLCGLPQMPHHFL